MFIDAVTTIKERLTISEVLNRYGYSVKKRIPCPIHCGRDDNFEIKEKTYCCHSHCGSGDVITLVQKLFDLAFPDALRKLDTDFGLNIYGDHTFEDVRRSHYQQLAVKSKKDRAKREKDALDNEYWKAFDEWKRLDDNRRVYKPKSPDEELHPLFVESLQKLSYQEYLVDCLDDRRKHYA
jgi:DNA primase